MEIVTEPISIATLAFQLGILAILFEAIRRRDWATAVNALVSFAVTVLPEVIEFIIPAVTGRSITFGPVLPLWLATAGLLHSYGMLGPYDSIWWWDSLTHTVSAALVAAIVYGGLVVVISRSVRSGSLLGMIPVLTVLFTVGAGVFWELIELLAREVGEHFDIEPVLVHYGLRDTAVDLGFDLLGALLVVLLDLRIFVPIADQFPQLTTYFVLGGGGLVVGGSLVLGFLFVLSYQIRQGVQ